MKTFKVLISFALAIILLNVGIIKGNAANAQIFNEKESNNTMKAANNLTTVLPKDKSHTLTIKGAFKNKSDVDYYQFTTAYENTKIEISLKTSEIPVGSFQIVDAKDKQVFSVDYDYELITATLPKGTYYLKVTGTKKTAGNNYQLVTKFYKSTPFVKAKIQNNLGSNDTITIDNLEKSKFYLVYWDHLNLKYKHFTATNHKKTLSIGPLNYDGGIIYIVTVNPDYEITAIKYAAEKLNAINAKNVKIKNNIGKDQIRLKGLTKGYTYTIYKDKKLKKKLISYTAKNKTNTTLTVKQIGQKAGSVYVVVSKKGYKSSVATKVNYKAQATSALSSKNVKVSNTKKKDTVKLTGLKKGTTYAIYKDANKKTKLASFTATKSTKTVTVTLRKSAGKIYITAKASGHGESAVTAVTYSKEK